VTAFATTPTAELRARFRCADGRTQLAHLFNKAPLKVAKTFALQNALGVCVMDASPGLLAGDFYNFSWHLEENAHVHLSTQGFTRVHPSRERSCLLRQDIRVETGALLEYLPEPLMLYKDAAVRSECEINIAGGGTVLFCDILCSGRIGHGEAFQFHSLQNRLRVRYNDELIFINQTSLRPHRFLPDRVGAWQNFTHQGNFYIFSEQADSTLCDTLRRVIEDPTASINTPLMGGASLLPRCGVAVSLLGRRACDLQDLTQRLRNAVADFLCAGV